MKAVLLLAIFCISAAFAHTSTVYNRPRQCTIGEELQNAVTECIRDIHPYFANRSTDGADQDDDDDDHQDVPQIDRRPSRRAQRNYGRRHGHRRASSTTPEQRLARVSSRVSLGILFKNSQFSNCAFRRAGVIDEDFKFVTAEAVNMIDEATIPEEKKVVLKDMMAECSSVHPAAVTASPILECVHTAFRLVCSLQVATQTEDENPEIDTRTVQ